MWGVFKDGVQYGMFLNAPETTREDPPPPNRGVAVGPTRADPALPSGKSATLFNFFPTEEAKTGQIVNVLGSAGYQPSVSHGQLDNFASDISSNTAFVFTNTHGGRLQGQNKVEHFYFLTRQRYSSTDETTANPYYADLKDGSVAIAQDPENRQLAIYYCIGPGFVRKHMRFGPNSVWINNACEGADDEFTQAALGKGLSAYIAWTDAVSRTWASNAAVYLADRLTGASSDSDYPIAPPQRPFDLPSILGDMAKTSGKDARTNPTVDESDIFANDPSWLYQWTGVQKLVHKAKLVATYASGPPTPSQQFAELAPTIVSLSVDEGNKQLTITAGPTTIQKTSDLKVTMAGKAMTVQSVANGHIVCALGPDDNGNVVVTWLGRQSNAVPLTMWTGAVHLTEAQIDRGTLAYTVNWNLKFRGDVHGPRFAPGATPSLPATSGICTPSSSANYSSTGAYTYQDNNQTFIDSWAGSGSLPNALTLTPPIFQFNRSNFDATFQIQTDSGTKKTTLSVAPGAFSGNAITQTTAPAGTTAPVAVNFPEHSIMPQNWIPWPIQVALDSGFNAGPGSKTVVTGTAPHRIRWTIVWDGFTAVDAPTANTSRAIDSP